MSELLKRIFRIKKETPKSGEEKSVQDRLKEIEETKEKPKKSAAGPDQPQKDGIDGLIEGFRKADAKKEKSPEIEFSKLSDVQKEDIEHIARLWARYRNLEITDYNSIAGEERNFKRDLCFDFIHRGEEYRKEKERIFKEKCEGNQGLTEAQKIVLEIEAGEESEKNIWLNISKNERESFNNYINENNGKINDIINYKRDEILAKLKEEKPPKEEKKSLIDATEEEQDEINKRREKEEKTPETSELLNVSKLSKRDREILEKYAEITVNPQRPKEIGEDEISDDYKNLVDEAVFNRMGMGLASDFYDSRQQEYELIRRRGKIEGPAGKIEDMTEKEKIIYADIIREASKNAAAHVWYQKVFENENKRVKEQYDDLRRQYGREFDEKFLKPAKAKIAAGPSGEPKKEEVKPEAAGIIEKLPSKELRAQVAGFEEKHNLVDAKKRKSPKPMERPAGLKKWTEEGPTSVLADAEATQSGQISDGKIVDLHVYPESKSEHIEDFSELEEGIIAENVALRVAEAKGKGYDSGRLSDYLEALKGKKYLARMNSIEGYDILFEEYYSKARNLSQIKEGTSSPSLKKRLEADRDAARRAMAAATSVLEDRMEQGVPKEQLSEFFKKREEEWNKIDTEIEKLINDRVDAILGRVKPEVKFFAKDEEFLKSCIDTRLKILKDTISEDSEEAKEMQMDLENMEGEKTLESMNMMDVDYFKKKRTEFIAEVCRNNDVLDFSLINEDKWTPEQKYIGRRATALTIEDIKHSQLDEKKRKEFEDKFVLVKEEIKNIIIGESDGIFAEQKEEKAKAEETPELKGIEDQVKEFERKKAAVLTGAEPAQPEVKPAEPEIVEKESEETGVEKKESVDDTLAKAREEIKKTRELLSSLGVLPEQPREVKEGMPESVDDTLAKAREEIKKTRELLKKVGTEK